MTFPNGSQNRNLHKTYVNHTEAKTSCGAMVTPNFLKVNLVTGPHCLIPTTSKLSLQHKATNAQQHIMLKCLDVHYQYSVFCVTRWRSTHHASVWIHTLPILKVLYYKMVTNTSYKCLDTCTASIQCSVLQADKFQVTCPVHILNSYLCI